MTNSITFRTATVADAAALHALIVALAEQQEQRAWLRATVDDLAATLTPPTPALGAVLAIVDGVPVGYASYTMPYAIWLGTHYLNLDDLYVAATHRDRGIGLALMNELAAVAAARGVRSLRWEVEPGNTAAIRFYQRLGATLRTKGVFTWEPGRASTT